MNSILSIRHNVIGALANQVSTVLIPLIIFPILISRIGEENFGVYGLILSITSVLIIFIDFGFNVYSTNILLGYNGNEAKIVEHYIFILLLKIFLLVPTTVILSILFHFKFFRLESKIFILPILIFSLGSILGPIWVFQGTNNLGVYGYLNVISKFIFYTILLIFVLDQNDLLLASNLWALTSLFPGIITLIYMLRRFRKARIKWIDFKPFQLLSKASNLFFSQALISSYTSLSVIIGSYFVNASSLGSYFLADRVIRGISAFMQPFTQNFYVKSKLTLLKGLNDYFLHVKKLFTYTLIIIPISIGIYLGSEIIAQYFLDDYELLSKLLKIMAPIPILVYLSNIVGTQFLLASDAYKEFLIGLLLSCGVNFSILFLLLNLHNVIGLGYSNLITETSVLIILGWIAMKKINDYYK